MKLISICLLIQYSLQLCDKKTTFELAYISYEMHISDSQKNSKYEFSICLSHNPNFLLIEYIPQNILQLPLPKEPQECKRNNHNECTMCQSNCVQTYTQNIQPTLNDYSIYVSQNVYKIPFYNIKGVKIDEGHNTLEIRFVRCLPTLKLKYSDKNSFNFIFRGMLDAYPYDFLNKVTCYFKMVISKVHYATRRFTLGLIFDESAAYLMSIVQKLEALSIKNNHDCYYKSIINAILALQYEKAFRDIETGNTIQIDELKLAIINSFKIVLHRITIEERYIESEKYHNDIKTCDYEDVYNKLDVQDDPYVFAKFENGLRTLPWLNDIGRITNVVAKKATLLVPTIGKNFSIRKKKSPKEIVTKDFDESMTTSMESDMFNYSDATDTAMSESGMEKQKPDASDTEDIGKRMERIKRNLRQASNKELVRKSNTYSRDSLSEISDIKIRRSTNDSVGIMAISELSFSDHPELTKIEKDKPDTIKKTSRSWMPSKDRNGKRLKGKLLQKAEHQGIVEVIPKVVEIPRINILKESQGRHRSSADHIPSSESALMDRLEDLKIQVKAITLDNVTKEQAHLDIPVFPDLPAKPGLITLPNDSGMQVIPDLPAKPNLIAMSNTANMLNLPVIPFVPNMPSLPDIPKKPIRPQSRVLQRRARQTNLLKRNITKNGLTNFI
jgi:hypothetical protein